MSEGEPKLTPEQKALEDSRFKRAKSAWRVSLDVPGLSPMGIHHEEALEEDRERVLAKTEKDKFNELVAEEKLNEVEADNLRKVVALFKKIVDSLELDQAIPILERDPELLKLAVKYFRS